jgi:hypothetical protein
VLTVPGINYCDEVEEFDRPCRDGAVFSTPPQHFVLGYYQSVPCGTSRTLLGENALGFSGEAVTQESLGRSPWKSAPKKSIAMKARFNPAEETPCGSPLVTRFQRYDAADFSFLGLRPISANLRGRDQDRCWRLEKTGPAGTSRKPSTKCWASIFKELSVPERAIERCRQSLSGMRDQTPSDSIVPTGTDLSFCIISQHFVLGYFH